MSQSLEELAAQVPGSTPALMQWLQTQLAAGHSPAYLHQSLLKAGWSRDIALGAMAVCKQPSSVATNTADMPEPDLSRHPSTIDVGDREVHVLLSMQKPRLVLFSNLLSDAECEQLIADARPAMTRSRTVATQAQKEEINPDRTSNGMFYIRGQTPVVALLEARIAKLLRWPVERSEGLQVLCYHPGAEYKPHHDYFNPAEASTQSILQHGGQRVGTLVIYLNDTLEGGCTFFPETQLRIHPRRGHAVFFSYDRPDAQTLTLHGGDPVLAGEKWIATKWLREAPFT